MQVRRSSVLDIAGLVEHMTDGAAQFGECLHAAGELPQARIRRIAVSVVGKKAHDLSHRSQQPLQVKQSLGRQEGARGRNLLEDDAQVKIVTQRKFAARLDNRQELVGLLEPANHLVATGRKTQARHIGSTQCAHAMPFQFPTHGIKAYLGLKS